MSNREVVLISAARTAIGTFGGSLSGTPTVDLAAQVVQQAVERSGIDPVEFGHVVFGNVAHTEKRDMYLSRYACIRGGLPIETPAVTLNRLCGSGLQAVVSASQSVLLGDCDVAIAGGAENMSRLPYWANGVRWGQRMGDAGLVDILTSALSDPFDDCHMGVTAENIAEKWKISRKDQDQLAVESHQKAVNAIEKGFFKGQITPVTVKQRRKEVQFDTDEHVRADASLESLAKMRPVFKKDGSVTAGNASGINDAAAAVVLADADYANRHGLTPMARLVGYSHAGVEPRYMGIGPVPAIRKLLDKTGVSIADIDVIELNEAFAAQALGVIRDLDLPMDKVNPNGSGISLGHPIGATGCILTIKAAYELQRTGGRYGLISMCIGGGQGIAALIENVN